MIVGQLYKLGPDEVLRRYVLDYERPLILAEAHVGIAGGHYSGKTHCIEGFDRRSMVAYLTQGCEGIL